MINTKVKGIVINARNYKENDKLLNIFCLENGKITVHARGVKQAKSKLKPYCQSFCFADFELTKKGNNYLITGINCIDSFFDITSDLKKFEYGCAILEVIDKTCKEGEVYSRLFLIVLKALRALCSISDSQKVFIKFLLDTLAQEGFKLNLDKCGCCNSSFMNKIYLNIDDGEIVCTACKKINNIQVLPSVHSAIIMLTNNDYEKLNTIKLSDEILREAQSLAVKNFNNKFSCKIKSLQG